MEVFDIGYTFNVMSRALVHKGVEPTATNVTRTNHNRSFIRTQAPLPKKPRTGGFSRPPAFAGMTPTVLMLRHDHRLMVAPVAVPREGMFPLFVAIPGSWPFAGNARRRLARLLDLPVKEGEHRENASFLFSS